MDQLVLVLLSMYTGVWRRRAVQKTRVYKPTVSSFSKLTPLLKSDDNKPRLILHVHGRVTEACSSENEIAQTHGKVI